jgi:hypothetical protein
MSIERHSRPTRATIHYPLPECQQKQQRRHGRNRAQGNPHENGAQARAAAEESPSDLRVIKPGAAMKHACGMNVGSDPRSRHGHESETEQIRPCDTLVQ